MDADTVINKILAFFGPVASSIKGSVNTAEILRVTLTALVSGGGVLGVLAAYQGDLSAILTSPTPVSPRVGWVRPHVRHRPRPPAEPRYYSHAGPCPCPAPRPCPGPGSCAPLGPDNFPK